MKNMPFTFLDPFWPVLSHPYYSDGMSSIYASQNEES